MKAKFILTFLLLLAGFCATAQTIHYVKPVASGSGNGSSWANASADLQAMITASVANDQVWVAAGTYYPTSTTDRTISFRMKAGVSIYGDFPATGTPVFTDRNLSLYETILSGDIDQNDGPNFANNSGNSYHVVSNNNNGVNSTAVLDGFTISGGNANSGTYPNNSGGGMLNIFTSPTLTNVIFSGNNAGVNGGAMLNVSSVPILKNILFISNNAVGQGGAIANSNASPNITNATFWANNAGSGAGGMFSYTLSSPTIKNSIFWGNTIGGATVSSIGGDFPGVTYSDIEGGYAGTGNINLDPLFLNSTDPDGADNKLGTADDGLTLRPCSPAVNTGNNTGVTTSDLLGNLRIYNVTADMGAYEYQNNIASGTGTRIYVDATAAPNGDGSSWATAYNNLQTALTSARLCTNINEIWVAKGTYKPTSGTDRTISFVLVPNVSIYGSFAGNETDTSQRTAAVMAANPTILSGDIDGVPDVVSGSGSTLVISGNTGNSHHVIYSNTSGVVTAGNSRLDGFTITGGNANGLSPANFGGGICLIGSGCRIRNVTFTGNNATIGGAISGSYHTLDLGNVSFIKNNAGVGAGVNFQGASVILNTVSFTDCKGGLGGALNCEDGTAIATNVTFSNNYAAGEGGGIRAITSVVSLSSVSFSNNSSVSYGGGVHMYGGDLTINKTNFINNFSDRDGGGIYQYSGDAQIDRCFFMNNTADNGGGIFYEGTSSKLRNIVFWGNHATQKGGAIHYYNVAGSADSRVYFATLTNNTASLDGGAIFCNSSSIDFIASILWGNKRGTDENNIIGGCFPNGCNVANSPNYSPWNIDENPLFVDAANPAGTDGILGTADDGLALSPCSPSINYLPYPYTVESGAYLSWYPTTITQDITGNTRKLNNYADMGAYENSSPGLGLPTVYTSKTQDIADTVFMEPGCKIMAKIVPDPTASGVNVLAGNVEVKEWVETAPFTMVRRHYQVTPANNSSTAKGRVTLYFTQEDFDVFNASGNPVQLPNTPLSSNPKIANIEVVKYSGSSPDGLPGGYPAQTPVIIPNSALKIWWLGTVWSISFDVTGFSGFFIKTAGVTLPVKLLSFTGKSTTSGNLLNWKTTNEVNFSHFEIERSTDGRQFAKIGTMNSNTSGNYEFPDAVVNSAAQYYYRLRMVDRDGKFTYSNIIRLGSFNPAKTFVGEVYPNPSNGTSFFEVNTVENSGWTVTVVDAMGRVVHSFTKSLAKGNHIIPVDNLQQGINYIKIESGNVHEFRKVVKM